MRNKTQVLKIAGRLSLPAIFFLYNISFSYSQGFNHTFLIGYHTSLFDTNVTSTKARLLFDTNSVTVTPETRKMAFFSAQGNISDANGNLIIATNGCWIANSTNDTMMNGSGLNPGQFTDDWCSNTSGIPFVHADIVLPWPGDSTKFILFHQTGNWSTAGMATELYYSVIDMTLDSGKGGVIQKNIVAFNDTLVPGMAACEHANGRDWWIVALKDSSDLIYKILLTPTGINNVTTENLNVPLSANNVFQPTFSPDGNKFAYTYTDNSTGSIYHDVRLLNFDRCTGMFSNPLVINLSDTYVGLGVAFSPNSKYLYSTSAHHIFQLNTDTSNITASLQIVAINDGYYSPYPPFQTDFFLMYLAADGKIYISSGNGVIDMHFINYPDSSGIACNVQQHALHLPCFYFRGNVYHPNYYLGCDTTLGCPCLIPNGIEEPGRHDFKFSISPNPNNGNFKIIYLLPQNKSGVLEIFDVNGRKVYSQNLPQWSTLQMITLPEMAEGIYQCIIRSQNHIASKKVVVMRR